jgi:hypothetical protein
MPNLSPELALPTPRKKVTLYKAPIKKEKSIKIEKGVKVKKGVKIEKSVKIEPTTPMTAKRLRPVSAEMSTTKRSVGAVTRQQARALSVPLEDEDEDAGLDPETGEPLPTLAEIFEGDKVGDSEV